MFMCVDVPLRGNIVRNVALGLLLVGHPCITVMTSKRQPRQKLPCTLSLPRTLLTKNSSPEFIPEDTYMQGARKD